MTSELLPEDRKLRALLVALAKQMRCEPELFYFNALIVELFRQGRIEFEIDAEGEAVFRPSEKGLAEWLSGDSTISEDEMRVLRSFGSWIEPP